MTEEIKPRSLIWLCDVPFNNDYKHVLTFNERISQLNYRNILTLEKIAQL